MSAVRVGTGGTLEGATLAAHDEPHRAVVLRLWRLKWSVAAALMMLLIVASAVFAPVVAPHGRRAGHAGLSQSEIEAVAERTVRDSCDSWCSGGDSWTGCGDRGPFGYPRTAPTP